MAREALSGWAKNTAAPIFAGKLVLVSADWLDTQYPTGVMGVSPSLLISVGGGLVLVLLGTMGKLGRMSTFAVIVGTFLLTRLVDVAMSYMGGARFRSRQRIAPGARPVNITPAVAPGVSPTEVAIY